MNPFIKKTFLFLFISLIMLILIIPSIHHIVKINSNFKIDNNYKYAIFGHSHSECAYNDSIINNCKNFSISGESYFYTFQKIQQILSHNKQIKTIFVEFSNNQIDQIMDEWIWGYKKMNNFLYWHSPFMLSNDFIYLFNKNSSNFLKSLSTSTRMNLIKIISLDFSLSNKYGRYFKLNKTLDLAKKQTIYKSSGISFANINYLTRIINYCQKQDVHIYLIRTPQHRYFHALKNEKDFSYIKQKYLNEIDFLDFQSFSLSDEEFADYGHLNSTGSKRFSIYFNSLLETKFQFLK